MAGTHKNSGNTKGKGDQTVNICYDSLLSALRQEFPEELSEEEICDELTSLTEVQLILNINNTDMARFLDIPKSTYREWASGSVVPTSENWKKIRYKIDELIQNGQKEKVT